MARAHAIISEDDFHVPAAALTFDGFREPGAVRALGLYARTAGENLSMTNAQDEENEEETLYVLQNQSLMEQIAASLRTHQEGKGYAPNPEELDELNHV